MAAAAPPAAAMPDATACWPALQEQRSMWLRAALLHMSLPVSTRPFCGIKAAAPTKTKGFLAWKKRNWKIMFTTG